MVKKGKNLNQQPADDVPQISAGDWQNIFNIGDVDITHLLAQILTAVPLRLLLLDKQGRVLAATEDCLQQVLHRKRAEVLMQFLPVALGFAENGGSFEELSEVLAVQGALEDTAVWHGRLHLPYSGSLPWQVKLQPLLNADGEWLAAILVFNERQRDAAEVEEDMRRRNQVAQTQDMLHMVKNCMQSIDGMLQVLARKCELNGVHIDTLPVVRQEVSEAIGMLADFGQESNLQSVVGLYSLNQLVEEVVRRQRSKFSVKQIELETDLAAELPPIWLDKQRLKQVLICCLDNSREAILSKGQPGGLVNITTQLEAGRDALRLVVADNGIGLTAEQQANFFKPYYTTKPQGNGIGVSICESIVRLHGGKMTVSGRPGEGCRVEIELPLSGGQSFRREDLYAEIAEMV